MSTKAEKQELEYKCSHCRKEVGTIDDPAIPRVNDYLCRACADKCVKVWVELPNVKPSMHGVIRLK